MTDRVDWQNGTWRAETPRGPEYELCIASDWAPIRAFDRMILEDPEAVYGDVMPELRASDLRIANLECPLTRSESAVSKSGSVLKGVPAHIAGLTCVPFDIVTLANNHVFDYGPDAFRETADLLGAHGIRGLGAGLNREAAMAPLVVELGETRIALISFSEGEDLTAASDKPGVFGWEVEAVEQAVRQARVTADLVVVFCHAGVEYIPFPPPYLARGAASGGPGRGRSGGRPPPPRAPGRPDCRRRSHRLQPGQLRLLPAGGAGLPQGGLPAQGGRVRRGPDRNPAGALRHRRPGPLPARRRAPEMCSVNGSGEMDQVSRPLETMAGIEDGWNGFLRQYGVDGFFNEIEMLMGKLREDPRKGAAMVRNRVATMQHREHWIDAMTRIIDGTIENSPDWAVELTREWLTRKR